MGYIYEAIDRAKEAITKLFGENEEQYKAVFDIIDRRQECQFYQLSHAAGHYLNPEFSYANPIEIIKNSEIMDGVLETLKRLDPKASR